MICHSSHRLPLIAKGVLPNFVVFVAGRIGCPWATDGNRELAMTITSEEALMAMY